MGRRSDASRPVGAMPSVSRALCRIKTGLPLMKLKLKASGKRYAASGRPGYLWPGTDEVE